MAANGDVLKQLRIKAGVVKRLAKETMSYEKEAEQMQKRLETMKSEGKDEYDIRKFEEQIKETLAVIPDCKNRLKAAFEDLTQLVEQSNDVDPETNEMKAANESLQLASPTVQA